MTNTININEVGLQGLLSERNRKAGMFIAFNNEHDKSETRGEMTA